jgi:hypothetical protein
MIAPEGSETVPITTGCPAGAVAADKTGNADWAKAEEPRSAAEKMADRIKALSLKTAKELRGDRVAGRKNRSQSNEIASPAHLETIAL